MKNKFIQNFMWWCNAYRVW